MQFRKAFPLLQEGAQIYRLSWTDKMFVDVPHSEPTIVKVIYDNAEKPFVETWMAPPEDLLASDWEVWSPQAASPPDEKAPVVEGKPVVEEPVAEPEPPAEVKPPALPELELAPLHEKPTKKAKKSIFGGKSK